MVWFGHAFLLGCPLWLLWRFPHVLWFLWRNVGRRCSSGLVVCNPLRRVCRFFALVFFLGRSFYSVRAVKSTHEFFEVDLGRFELLRWRIVVVRSLAFFGFFRGGRGSRFCRNRPAWNFKEWTRHIGLGLSDPLVVAVGSLPRSLCCKKGKWEESRPATGHPLSLVLVHQLTKDKNLLSPSL